MKPELDSLESDAALPGMSRKLIKQMFEHEFTDEKGRVWTSKIHEDETPLLVNEFSGETSGRVYCDGQFAGSFTRSVTFYSDGRRLCVHKALELHDEPGRRYQKQGFATRFNALCAAEYEAAGIDRVTLNTGDYGLATWPLRGFDLAASRSTATLDGQPAAPCDFASSDYTRALEFPLARMEENIQDIEDETQRAAALKHLAKVRAEHMDLEGVIRSNPEWARQAMHMVKVRLYAEPSDLLAHDIRINP